MKGFAEWAKTNWLILVLSAVALVALPTMFYFSSKMSKGLRAGVQKQAADDYREVSNANINYSVNKITAPDKKGFEITAEANKVYIEQLAAMRTAIQQQAGKVGKEALDFNRAGHKLLLEGVFPHYSPGQQQRLSLKFAEVYALEAYPELLKRVNAGTPPDSKQLADQLGEYFDQQKTRILSQVGGATLGKEDELKLQKELLDQRIGRYRQRASEIVVYADPSIFADVPPPPVVEQSLSKYWDWQTRYWINEDLLKAVAAANASSTMGVPGGVVKRILKITIDPPQYNDSGDVPRGTPSPEGDAVAEAPKVTDPAPVNSRVSITGRESGPHTGNQYYDLRNATVEMNVSSARLPEFFDALAATNFMTVLKVDLEKIEPLEDVREGFYYGDEHVVKATLQIETLWLRAWTKQYMPKPVRQSLGVAEDPPAEGAPPG